jgi:hypothetical protein
MKKMYFFVLVFFLTGIAVVSAQTSLSQGQVFTANMTTGAVHTYRIQLRGDAEYFIAWEDSDNTRGDGFADVMVGVRGSEWGQYLIEVQDSGNFGKNVHRLVNRNSPGTKRNPLDVQSGEEGAVFSSNTEHIIEVRGYGNENSGPYKIVFY